MSIIDDEAGDFECDITPSQREQVRVWFQVVKSFGEIILFLAYADRPDTPDFYAAFDQTHQGIIDFEIDDPVDAAHLILTLKEIKQDVLGTFDAPPSDIEGGFCFRILPSDHVRVELASLDVAYEILALAVQKAGLKTLDDIQMAPFPQAPRQTADVPLALPSSPPKEHPVLAMQNPVTFCHMPQRFYPSVRAAWDAAHRQQAALSRKGETRLLPCSLTSISLMIDRAYGVAPSPAFGFPYH